jgi:prevent-host-death family protein
MREVGAFEAKNKLGTLLDWVASGEEVLITRHGKAIARLVPATPTFDKAKARMAARGLLEASRGIKVGGRIKIKDLINEGRP